MLLHNKSFSQIATRFGAPVFATAIGLAGLPASASVIDLYLEHDVSEFTNVARTVASGKTIDEEITIERETTYDSTIPCCVSGSARSIYKSFGPTGVNDDQFGSRVEIKVGDAGAEDRTITAGGQITSYVRVTDQYLTFRISKTKLQAAQGATAKLKFGLFLHEIPTPLTLPTTTQSVLNGPTLFEGQYESTLFGGNFSNPTAGLTINQSGFQTALPEADFYDAGVRNHEWDFGVFEGVVDIYAAGLKLGDEFGLNYTWDVEVHSEYGGFPGTASASFFDPLGSEGGLSLDFSSQTEIPLDGLTVSAVPLPAGMWLLGSGLMALLFGRRRTRAT